jgi:putative endonuclease
MRDHDYRVYILANKHCTTLYVGVPNSLMRRLSQHRRGELAGFTSRYRLNRLVWFEHFRNVRDAIACEKKLKGWRRSKKLFLIEKTNPRWLDRRLGTAAQNIGPALGGGGNDPRFFASLRMTS